MSRIARQFPSHSRWKKNYYRRRRFHPPGHQKRGPDFTPEEDKEIVLHQLTDTQLAQKLHRSVSSVQVRRSRLKNKKNGLTKICYFCSQQKRVCVRTKTGKAICASCWHKEFYLPPREKCSSCGKIKTVASRLNGVLICHSCYYNRNRLKLGICQKCRGVKIIQAKGLCRRCYKRLWRKLKKKTLI